VFLGSLSEALAHDGTFLEENLAVHANSDSNAFLALNTAFLADAVVLDIPRGIVVDVPIHILHVSQSGAEPTVSHPRFIARFGAHSQSTVIESYIGDKGAVYFTNAATELIVADSAVVDHYKVQRESLNAFHVATTQVVAGPSTAFTSHSLTFGGHFVRNDINAMLVGERSETTLNGLYLGSGNQLVDNHTSIDHAVPNCASHEIYKGILSGRARGVFNGKIYVHQDAQKTDAKQTNKTLLLSDEAQINTKPQLEIFADDVRCTHGATIGQLDDEGLFYLRSRGIGKKQAQSILVYAFASDIVSRIKVEPVRAQLDRVLLKERALEESD
jgi:Fe-S cluster assembly protein SufD